MLALDNSIGCIEASESDILVLYRSFNNARVAGDGPEFREAYICAIRKGGKVYSYLAIIADNGRILVYTKPGDPDTEEGYPQTIEEALALARSLGFAPEPVNLNYSSAMREVVVRNIRILRPPAGSMAPLKNASADAPTPKGEGREARQKAAPAPPPVYQEAPPPPSPEAVLRQEDEVKILRNCVANLKVELSLVGAERDVLARKGEELAHLHQAATAELAKAKEDLVQAGVERERERCAAGSAVSEAAAVKREGAVLSRQLRAANLRREETAEQNARLEQAVRDGEERVANMSQELEAALRREEQLACEKEEAVRETEALRRELDSATAAVERLQQEHEEHLMAARAKAAASSAGTVAQFQEQLQEIEAKLARVVRERDRALEEHGALAAETTRLMTENEGLRAELTALLAQPDEAPRDDVRLPETAPVALRDEYCQEEPAPVQGEKAVEAAEEKSPIPMPDPAPAPQPPPAAAAATPLAEFPPFCGFGDNFFSAAADGEEIPFLLQPNLSAVEYLAADDVLQLYSSVNVAYLSPEGKGQETCQGYACSVRNGERVEVYAALYGMQSGKTRVYAPARQPADAGECAAVLKGAIAFADQVGLMMEAEKPGLSAQQRRQLVESCPVLNGVQQD